MALPTKPSGLKQQKQIQQLKETKTALQEQVAQLGASHTELSLILEHVPLVIMIVDQNRRVQKISRSASKETGLDPKAVLGLRSGDILRCIHHLDNDKGCGFGAACQDCLFRETVLNTLETGTSHHRVEIQMSLEKDQPLRKTVLISTALLENRDRDAVVFVEDITAQRKAEEKQEALIGQLKKALVDIKKLNGLLPICAGCKKIRDDKGYWKQIETYIEDHSEATFSHGICPECREKLYPKKKVRSPGRP